MYREQRTYYAYVMASVSGVLYIGVTNNLELRVRQHQTKSIPGFTQRYIVTRLVHFEPFDDVRDAIAREKQLKGWLRSKKVALVEESNPEWRDLSKEWNEPQPGQLLEAPGER